jgi:prepilin-type N-terminal cleavage/methylation domain-containing protein
MRDRRRTTRGGFSLLEVVIVVAIIAILAAIGIPRMSRGSRGANDSALSGDLAVLRNAIDLYAAEHGGSLPTLASIVNQLTLYSDADGATNSAKTSPYIYGPYVRSIPPVPVGFRKGQNGISDLDGATIGWLYDETTGEISANAQDTDVDDSNVKYNTY